MKTIILIFGIVMVTTFVYAEKTPDGYLCSINDKYMFFLEKEPAAQWLERTQEQMRFDGVKVDSMSLEMVYDKEKVCNIKMNKEPDVYLPVPRKFEKSGLDIFIEGQQEALK